MLMPFRVDPPVLSATINHLLFVYNSWIKNEFRILDVLFYDPGPTQDYEGFDYKVVLAVLHDFL